MMRCWEQDTCGKNILGQNKLSRYAAMLDHEAIFSSLFLFYS